MKLGVGSYAFRWSIGIKDRIPARPMRAIEVLESTHALGLGLVQFADNLPLHTLPEPELAALGARARELGMTLEVGQQSFDRPMLERYLAIAGRLDARLVRIALDADDAAIPLQTLADEFRQVIPAFRDAGVVIAIENHFNYPSPRLVELLSLIDDDTVGVCLDVANSICAEEWPMETVLQLAPFAVNLHLKDYDIVPDRYGVGFRIQGVPLGQGRTDIAAVFKALADQQRDVNVLIEHWLPESPSIIEDVARERDWLQQSVAEGRRWVPD